MPPLAVILKNRCSSCRSYDGGYFQYAESFFTRAAVRKKSRRLKSFAGLAKQLLPDFHQAHCVFAPLKVDLPTDQARSVVKSTTTRKHGAVVYVFFFFSFYRLFTVFYNEVAVFLQGTQVRRVNARSLGGALLRQLG